MSAIAIEKLDIQPRRPDFKIRKSKFVDDFAGTPMGIHCPTFRVIKCGHRCGFNPYCSYCFLHGTLRIEGKPIIYSNRNDMLREVERDFEKHREPTLYNAGELADSLMDPDTIVELIKLFATQKTHKLLLLTKSDQVAPLYCLDHKGRTIVSFSMNSNVIAGRFEAGAPDTVLRNIAASIVADRGYPLRLRIDPMIPVLGWGGFYLYLSEMLEKLLPRVERITLGSLRYYPAVKAHAPSSPVFDYATERSPEDGRYRVLTDVRTAMYGHMMHHLNQRGYTGDYGLCKETSKVFRLLDMDPAQLKCNCTW